ncbi:Hypothetical protein LUCI_2836 [Lucifera butyrica]|uniref:Uncharacterized protein n=1 Tax=Lucifera butyrica TaxID=1351585 RepID=A0A498R855_9FIRM|nr:hypothetical protein [Lucifera butyrica]VBB07571.1 Hypothetical protein LUCI_2836 [Lucifera butyrica]
MIYEILRAAAGPYLRSAIDFYIANQNILNPVVVITGFLWIVFSRKSLMNRSGEKTNWLGVPNKR